MDSHSTRTDLYPNIEPFADGILDLDGRHRMYWEQSGNPSGVPVVFLHGGPGAGSAPVHRRFFDPRFYRIVVFDQRGAGRSLPQADLTDNTTAHLIADMESLRKELAIERWLVFGGSWGATLALAYGQAHPERCLGFVLRGVFLGRMREMDWFFEGMGNFFPEAKRHFIEHLAEDERADALGAYHRRLTHADPRVRARAAGAWCRYENACSRLVPNPDDLASQPVEGGPGALALARIEAHYFRNRMFLADNELLAGLAAVTHLPAVIVQGRYDMVCPIVTAEELARGWRAADLRIVADAGHSALEPGIRAALVEATDCLRDRFEGTLGTGLESRTSL